MDKSKYYGISYVSRHDKNIANKKFIVLLYTALKPIHKEFNTLQMIFTMGITGGKKSHDSDIFTKTESHAFSFQQTAQLCSGRFLVEAAVPTCCFHKPLKLIRALL